MNISKVLLLSLTIKLSFEACLQSSELVKLGLIPLIKTETVSKAPICKEFYDKTKARACVNLSEMETKIGQQGKDFSVIYADEQYEILMSLDLIIDNFFRASAEIQTKQTYIGVKVTQNVIDKFQTANEWLDNYEIDFAYIKEEIVACNKAQQANVYGAYCYLSSDLGSTTVANTQTEIPLTSTNETKIKTTRLLAESSTAYQFAISTETSSEIVGQCINNIKTICIYFYMRDALNAAQGISRSQHLKTKCKKDFFKCKNTVKASLSMNKTTPGCSSTTKAIAMKTWMGGFGNRMIDKETQSEFEWKGYISGDDRDILYGKFKAFGAGTSLQGENNFQKRRQDFINQEKSKKSSTTTRRLVDMSSGSDSPISFNDSQNGVDTYQFGTNSGWVLYESGFLFKTIFVVFWVLTLHN